MKKKVRATIPKLNNRNGNLKKQWFVYYNYWNERTQKYDQFRVYKGFTDKKTKLEKTRYSDQLINELTLKLRNGYDPIMEKEAEYIFYDEIEYSHKTNLGGRNKRSNKTVNYLANKYLAFMSEEISKPSYVTYQSKLRIFIYWISDNKMKKVDVSAITPKHIETFFDYLTNVRKIGNSRKMYKEMISRMFDYGVKQKMLFENPVKEIIIKKRKPLPPRYFDEKSLVKMKSYMLENDKQLWFASRLIFYCFIRPKEIRYMKVRDLLIDEGMIRVRADISKNRKERYPVIPEKFRKELIEEGYCNYPDNYYLITKSGKPGTKGVGKNYLWEHFDKMRKALKIPKENKFYGFKHTGMIMSKKSGADSKDIQMQAGHHSLDMLDKYINQMMPVESDHLRFNGPTI